MKSFKGVWEKLIDAINRLTQLSLSNTKPMYINDTVERTDVRGIAIQAENDITFTTLISPNEHNDSNGLSNMTIKAGHIIYMHVDTVEFAGGKGVIYTR